MSNESKFVVDARRVVEDKLKADRFIETHKEQIYDKLEQCYRRGRDAGAEGEMMFIAESLPLISGVVHVGSTLEDFQNATDWVRQKLPGADPVSVLSALTFIYIVEKAYDDLSDSREKREIWERIRKRVKALL